MANVLAALSAILFSSARIIPTEMTGYLGAIGTDFDDKGVAVGGTVKVQSVPKLSVGATPVPSMAFAAGADRTPTTIDLILNQTAQVSWNLTAEEERQLLTSENAQETLRQTVEQGWRSLRNQIEAYLGTVAKNSASRAVGTAGTTPFGSNTNDLVDLQTLLKENGAGDQRSLIMSLAASANLQKLSNLQKISEAGSAALLRDGVLGRLHGFDLRESAGVAAHTKGTGSGYLINSAALVAGSTTIPVDTGTGTILAGDVIAIAGDARKYVVKTALTGGNVVIQEPGLLGAVADNAAVTVENNYTGNVGIDRNAMKAVIRPALQPNGAIAEQRVISDDKTGFSALFLRVPGDGMASWYMRTVYDAFAPNPYGIALFRG